MSLSLYDACETLRRAQPTLRKVGGSEVAEAIDVLMMHLHIRSEAALRNGLHSTTSIGNPDPNMRAAVYTVEFRGADAVSQLHRFDDAMRVLRGVVR